MIPNRSITDAEIRRWQRYAVAILTRVPRAAPTWIGRRQTALTILWTRGRGRSEKLVRGRVLLIRALARVLIAGHWEGNLPLPHKSYTALVALLDGLAGQGEAEARHLHLIEDCLGNPELSGDEIGQRFAQQLANVTAYNLEEQFRQTSPARVVGSGRGLMSTPWTRIVAISCFPRELELCRDTIEWAIAPLVVPIFLTAAVANEPDPVEASALLLTESDAFLLVLGRNSSDHPKTDTASGPLSQYRQAKEMGQPRIVVLLTSAYPNLDEPGHGTATIVQDKADHPMMDQALIVDSPDELRAKMFEALRSCQALPSVESRPARDLDIRTRGEPQMRLTEETRVAELRVITGAGSSNPEIPRSCSADDNVQFSVFTPMAVMPERWYSMISFAHLTDQIGRIHQLAEALLGNDSSPTTLHCPESIPLKSLITFQPHGPGVQFNPASVSFEWLEPFHRQDFRFRASPELDGQTVRAHLTVIWGTRILADVLLKIPVSSTRGAVPVDGPSVRASAQPYRKIFTSYSHADGEIVAELEKAFETVGDRFIRDATALRSGEVWTEGLAALIREADIFQLYWSESAMRKPFVRQEWEYALSLNRKNFVRPFYWKEPMAADKALGLPPKQLLDLHFHYLPRRLAGTESP